MTREHLGAWMAEVRDSEPLPLMSHVAEAYEAQFGSEPEDRGGWYEPDGWKRISRVFERLDLGGDLLDVGTGAGQFINCVALSRCFRSATTTDPTVFKKYIELSDDIERLNDSIEELPFKDKSFDVVTCMEVLEHLPEEIFRPAIDELRRVCRGQLAITVPYREPQPISKTHVRGFEDENLLKLFPEARFTILRRPNKPWVLIEEYTAGYPDNGHGASIRQLNDLQREVARIESEAARLRNRKSLRAANWVGRRYRETRAAIANRITPE